jgi:hypothetical protein
MLFFTSFLHAQIQGDVYDDGDGRVLSQVEFERAIILYDKYAASDDFIERNKLYERLSLIANKESYPQEFVAYEENINDQKIQNWVNKNVAKENHDKAIKLLSRIVTLNNKINIDNSEIIDILKHKASLDQCQEIENPKLRDR